MPLSFTPREHAPEDRGARDMPRPRSASVQLDLCLQYRQWVAGGKQDREDPRGELRLREDPEVRRHQEPRTEVPWAPEGAHGRVL